MLRRPWRYISLARKISLLFGTAVLLTICVTLVFPWLHMTNLNEEALLMHARWVATAAYGAVDLRQPDWGLMRRQLEQRWPLLMRDLGLPSERPTLVPIAGSGPSFHAEAIERFRRNADQSYYWKVSGDGATFRFAMAIRGTDTDPHPHVVRGIIDVRLPVPKSQGVWNSVVTVLAGASGAVLAILIFYLVTQRLVLSPVTSLRQVAEKVTVGDIDVRSSITSGDEFEDLSEAFNDMLAHLREAHDELEKTNRSLDIRLGELAETNIALFESNRLKSQFLANVTHELRTPLVSIIGFAELLRDARDTPDADRTRLARYSENILISGRNLLEIINDLLDLAKIEAGKMELHVTEFCVADLCRDLIDFMRPLADKKKQQLELQVASELPRLHSDSGKIRQILYNLLSNAVKFTPQDGAISLRVEHDREVSVRLIVSDTGPGIDEAKKDAIFEKFHQLDASQTREYEGTGLGLAITRELVQVLGGSITLDSAIGRGATFVITLPVRTRISPERPRIPPA